MRIAYRWALAAACSASGAAFADCTYRPDAITPDVINVNGGTCSIRPDSYRPRVGWETFLSVFNGAQARIDGPIELAIQPASTKATVTTTGISVYEVDGAGLPALLQADTITLDMTALPADIATQNLSKIGLDINRAGKFQAKNLKLDLLIANNGTSNMWSYGILAGNSVNSGAGSSAAQQHPFSYVELENADISVDTSPSQLLGTFRNTTSAIRALSVRGSSGYVRISGHTRIRAKGRYSTGLYISGKDSQVHLHDSTITTEGTGNISHAAKLGKVRAAGTGGAKLYSTGQMQWDTSAARGTPSILLLDDDTLLQADAPGSQGAIVSAGNAILFGNLDVTDYTQSQGVNALFRNTSFTTTNATASLFKVSAGQTDATLSLKGSASRATAPANGWLMEVEGPNALANYPAAARLLASDGAQLQGLTQQQAVDSNLSIDLNNAATWTLAEKTGGDKTRASFTTLTMRDDARLQAFKSGAAAFVLQGQVTSAASAIDLQDGEPDDLLTIDGSYHADNARLRIDSCLGDSSAASDKLVVAAATSGRTVLVIAPTAGAQCQGAATSGDGILVVEVQGDSDGSFVLPAGPLLQGAFSYELVQVGKNWYLQSQAVPPGQIELLKQVQVPSGAPAYNGSIDVSLRCPNTGTNLHESLSVSNNEGRKALSVPAGSECTLEEQLPTAPDGFAWESPAYTQPGPVASGASQSASIVNRLRAVPLRTGQMTVQKTVTVPSGAAPYDGSISFAVQCVRPNFSYSGTLNVHNNQGSATVSNIPVGSECLVSETLPTAPNGFRWDTPAYSQPAPITADANNAARIGNTLVSTSGAKDAKKIPANSAWALALLTLALVAAQALHLRRSRQSKRTPR